MTLKIGDTAPDFEADTTQGRIRFHEWLGNHWGVLFSHPKDFTPVCTTELGYLAKLEPEFEKRNAKVIGLSVDPIDDHNRWLRDVESHGVATPVNWKQGEDCIIVPSVSDEQAREKFPGGWKTELPYLRRVPQPGREQQAEISEAQQPASEPA